MRVNTFLTPRASRLRVIAPAVTVTTMSRKALLLFSGDTLPPDVAPEHVSRLIERGMVEELEAAS